MTDLATTSNVPATLEGLMTEDSIRLAIEKVLPRHLTADRLVRLVASALRTTRHLGECTQESFLGALMCSAQTGLEPNTPLGHAWLVPYLNKKRGEYVCTFIPGYKGLLQLVYQSDRVASANAFIRYENDEFSLQEGTDISIFHKPILDDAKRGGPIGAYAVIKIKSGDPVIRYLNKEQIERVRPQHWKSTPWADSNADVVMEMWMKTALRRIAKYSPVSTACNLAVVADEAAQRGATWRANLEEPEDLTLVDDGYQKPALPPAGNKSAKREKKDKPPEQTEEQTSFAGEADQTNQG